MVSESLKKLSIGIILFLATLYSSFSQVLLDKVVASVNGEPILMTDVIIGMSFYNTDDEKAVVQRLIDTWILSQYVESKGAYVSDEYVDNMLLDIAKANNKSLDKLIEDLHKQNISAQDLKNFLRKLILSTQALDILLLKEIRVSDIETEIEKLKRGNLKFVKEIKLLVVDKKDSQKLSQLVEKEKDVDKIAQSLGIKMEHLEVGKGELIDALDREVWKAGKGEIVFAEDENHIYIAQILGQKEVLEGVNTEILKEELLQRKLESARKDLLEKLKKRSFIRVG